MAQRILTVLTDDIDGKELKNGQGETVTFGIDGHTYEIDLSKKNAEEFRSVLTNYIEHGRRVTNKSKNSRPKRSQSGPSAQEIRDWARSNGHDVPERGRIPGNVREAFDAAH